MILKINDRIRNRKVDYFNKFSLSLRYDAVASSFAFNGYFNPDNSEHKDLYCIGHFHEVTLEHNGELLLSGYITSESFHHKSVRQGVSIGGYSYPGVLEDCQVPLSAYPLQMETSSIKEIAERYIKPFKLSMTIDPSVSSAMNAVLPETTANESQSVKSFLTELAAQKNIIVSHNAKGQLVFTKAKTNQNAILNYGGDGLPCPEMNLQFNGQAMHSHITVMKQADSEGGNSAQFEIKNPFVPYAFRPKVVIQNSGDDNDTEQAAKNMLAAELKNLKLIIKTDRWEIDGKVIKPNNIITVLNPEVYLYKKTKWFIEQVDLNGDSERMVATLTCVLPCVYDGSTPEYIFKGINEH